jgi:hypothetical protein
MPFILLMFLNAKLVAHLFWTLSLRMPTRSIRDYATFTVHRNFKVSPSAGCDTAANAVCRSIHIFNKDYILITDVSQLFK